MKTPGKQLRASLDTKIYNKLTFVEHSISFGSDHFVGYYYTARNLNTKQRDVIGRTIYVYIKPTITIKDQDPLVFNEGLHTFELMGLSDAEAKQVTSVRFFWDHDDNVPSKFPTLYITRSMNDFTWFSTLYSKGARLIGVYYSYYQASGYSSAGKIRFGRYIAQEFGNSYVVGDASFYDAYAAANALSLTTIYCSSYDKGSFYNTEVKYGYAGDTKYLHPTTKERNITFIKNNEELQEYYEYHLGQDSYQEDGTIIPGCLAVIGDTSLPDYCFAKKSAKDIPQEQANTTLVIQGTGDTPLKVGNAFNYRNDISTIFLGDKVDQHSLIDLLSTCKNITKIYNFKEEDDKLIITSEWTITEEEVVFDEEKEKGYEYKVSYLLKTVNNNLSGDDRVQLSLSPTALLNYDEKITIFSKIAKGEYSISINSDYNNNFEVVDLEGIVKGFLNTNRISGPIKIYLTDGIFKDWTNLKGVKFPKEKIEDTEEKICSQLYFENRTFYNCSSLVSLLQLEDVAELTMLGYTKSESDIEAGGQFCKCSSLKRIKLPNEWNCNYKSTARSASCFPPYFVQDCSLLTKLLVKDQQEETKININEIYEYTFSNCINLDFSNFEFKDVDIIKDHAFYRCTKLTNNSFKKNALTRGTQGLVGWMIFNKMDVEELQKSESIFEGCTSLVELELPFFFIGKRWFSGCSSLINVSFDVFYADNPNETKIKTGAMPWEDLKYQIGESAFEGCNSLTKFIINNTTADLQGFVISQDFIIKTNAFKGCTNLTNFKMNFCNYLYDSETLTYPKIILEKGCFSDSFCKENTESTFIIDGNFYIDNKQNEYDQDNNIFNDNVNFSSIQLLDFKLVKWSDTKFTDFNKPSNYELINLRKKDKAPLCDITDEWVLDNLPWVKAKDTLKDFIIETNYKRLPFLDSDYKVLENVYLPYQLTSFDDNKLDLKRSYAITNLHFVELDYVNEPLCKQQKVYEKNLDHNEHFYSFSNNPNKYKTLLKLNDNNELAILFTYNVNEQTTDGFYYIPNLIKAEDGTVIGEITSVERYAFGNDGYLTDFSFKELEGYDDIIYSLPQSINTIESHAFYGSKVEQVCLPSNLNELSQATFFNCSSLQWISFFNNKLTIAKSSVVFSTQKDTFCIIANFEPTELKDYNSLVNLANDEIGQCLANAYPVDKTDIKENRYWIVNFAINRFYNLGDDLYGRILIDPDAPAKCKLRIFGNGTHLQGNSGQSGFDIAPWSDIAQGIYEIDLSDAPNVDTIDPYMFANTSIQEIVLPKSINTFSQGLFANCSSLTQVSWQDSDKHSLDEIKEAAFSNCSSLEGFSEISNFSVANVIGERAFQNCKKLKQFFYYGEEKKTENKIILNEVNSQVYEGCSNLFSQREENLTIVFQDSIGKEAFKYTEFFSDKTIECVIDNTNKEIKIEDGAFQDASLSKITFILERDITIGENGLNFGTINTVEMNSPNNWSRYASFSHGADDPEAGIFAHFNGLFTNGTNGLTELFFTEDEKNYLEDDNIITLTPSSDYKIKPYVWWSADGRLLKFQFSDYEYDQNDMFETNPSLGFSPGSGNIFYCLINGQIDKFLKLYNITTAPAEAIFVHSSSSSYLRAFVYNSTLYISANESAKDQQNITLTNEIFDFDKLKPLAPTILSFKFDTYSFEKNNCFISEIVGPLFIKRDSIGDITQAILENLEDVEILSGTVLKSRYDNYSKENQLEFALYSYLLEYESAQYDLLYPFAECKNISNFDFVLISLTQDSQEQDSSEQDPPSLSIELKQIDNILYQFYYSVEEIDDKKKANVYKIDLIYCLPGIQRDLLQINKEIFEKETIQNYPILFTDDKDQFRFNIRAFSFANVSNINILEINEINTIEYFSFYKGNINNLIINTHETYLQRNTSNDPLELSSNFLSFISGTVLNEYSFSNTLIKNLKCIGTFVVGKEVPINDYEYYLVLVNHSLKIYDSYVLQDLSIDHLLQSTNPNNNPMTWVGPSYEDETKITSISNNDNYLGLFNLANVYINKCYSLKNITTGTDLPIFLTKAIDEGFSWGGITKEDLIWTNKAALENFSFSSSIDKLHLHQLVPIMNLKYSNDLIILPYEIKIEDRYDFDPGLSDFMSGEILSAFVSSFDKNSQLKLYINENFEAVSKEYTFLIGKTIQNLIKDSRIVLIKPFLGDPEKDIDVEGGELSIRLKCDLAQTPIFYKIDGTHDLRLRWQFNKKTHILDIEYLTTIKSSGYTIDFLDLINETAILPWTKYTKDIFELCISYSTQIFQSTESGTLASDFLQLSSSSEDCFRVLPLLGIKNLYNNLYNLKRISFTQTDLIKRVITTYSDKIKSRLKYRPTTTSLYFRGIFNFLNLYHSNQLQELFKIIEPNRIEDLRLYQTDKDKLNDDKTKLYYFDFMTNCKKFYASKILIQGIFIMNAGIDQSYITRIENQTNQIHININYPFIYLYIIEEEEGKRVVKSKEVLYCYDSAQTIVNLNNDISHTYTLLFIDVFQGNKNINTINYDISAPISIEDINELYWDNFNGVNNFIIGQNIPSEYIDTIKNKVKNKVKVINGYVDFNQPNVIYKNEDKKTLARYISNENEKVLEVSETVTALEDECFKNGYYLEQVFLPEQIAKISNKCFENCFNLDYIHLPENLKQVGQEAFKNCLKLKHLSFPESMEYYGTTQKISDYRNNNELYIYPGSYSGIDLDNFYLDQNDIQDLSIYSNLRFQSPDANRTTSIEYNGQFSNTNLKSIFINSPELLHKAYKNDNVSVENLVTTDALTAAHLSKDLSGVNCHQPNNITYINPEDGIPYKVVPLYSKGRVNTELGDEVLRRDCLGSVYITQNYPYNSGGAHGAVQTTGYGVLDGNNNKYLYFDIGLESSYEHWNVFLGLNKPKLDQEKPQLMLTAIQESDGSIKNGAFITDYNDYFHYKEKDDDKYCLDEKLQINKDYILIQYQDTFPGWHMYPTVRTENKINFDKITKVCVHFKTVDLGSFGSSRDIYKPEITREPQSCAFLAIYDVSTWCAPTDIHEIRQVSFLNNHSQPKEGGGSDNAFKEGEIEKGIVYGNKTGPEEIDLINDKSSSTQNASTDTELSFEGKTFTLEIDTTNITGSHYIGCGLASHPSDDLSSVNYKGGATPPGMRVRSSDEGGFNGYRANQQSYKNPTATGLDGYTIGFIDEIYYIEEF